MKGLLGNILDNADTFDEYCYQAEKQGYTIKESFKPIFERYKKTQHLDTGIKVKIN